MKAAEGIMSEVRELIDTEVIRLFHAATASRSASLRASVARSAAALTDPP